MKQYGIRTVLLLQIGLLASHTHAAQPQQAQQQVPVVPLSTHSVGLDNLQFTSIMHYLNPPREQSLLGTVSAISTNPLASQILSNAIFYVPYYATKKYFPDWLMSKYEKEDMDLTLASKRIQNRLYLLQVTGQKTQNRISVIDLRNKETDAMHKDFKITEDIFKSTIVANMKHYESGKNNNNDADFVGKTNKQLKQQREQITQLSDGLIAETALAIEYIRWNQERRKHAFEKRKQKQEEADTEAESHETEAAHSVENQDNSATT